MMLLSRNGKNPGTAGEMANRCSSSIRLHALPPALFLTLALASTPTPAAADSGCGGKGLAGSAAPEIRVKTSIAEPKIRRDLSRAELSAGQPKNHLSHGKIQMKASAEVRLAGVQQPASADHGACFVVKRVSVNIRLDPATIFIASELPSGGCGFRVTRAHEMRHFAVQRDALLQQTRSLKSRLASQLASASPTTSGGRGEPEAARSLVGSLVNKALQRARADAEAGHASLDSPANYRREAAKCKSW